MKQTTWISGGEPVTVSTDCWESETEAECQDRHDSAVVMWEAVYPED
jgi:hypothetical protein